MTLLAWIVWRYVERPVQRWTREFLTGRAARFGWSSRPNAPVRS
jgi:peptidoglycan/LPS O-acetylase OafA/YrhL